MREEILKVLKKLEALCSKNEKCESYAFKYMTDRGADEKEAALAVEYLVENGFVDNKRYAGAFARDKFRFNKWGKRRIESELKMKKISKEDIASALEIEEISLGEEDLIVGELKKKLRSLKNSPVEKIKEKLLRFSLGRGYAYQTSKTLIDNLLREN